MKINFIFLVLIIISFGKAQNNSNDIILGKVVKVESKILNEERPILVYIPTDYNKSKEKYPVLYLLDGGAHFLHTSGIIQILTRSGRIPQMIIIGIPNTNRNRDFTPTKVDDLPNAGGADKFLDFLKTELMPFVKENYRTQPYNIVFGHSLTGMFGLYSFASDNELFNSYIIASPYLQYDNEFVINITESYLKISPNSNCALYITVGNEPDYFPSLDKLTNLFDTYSLENVKWKYVKMENEDHGSVPHKTIYDGLEFIYSDWRITNEQLANGIEAVDEHYNNLNKHYGYKIKIPEFLLNQIGYRYINQKMYNEAITVFKRNINSYPKSANVHDSMGDAYAAAGQLENAKESYSKAIKRGTELSDPNLQIYKNNLASVVKKLSE